MITAIEALARLRDGNRRFVANQTRAAALSDHARRAALVAGQEPFSIVDRVRPSVEALLSSRREYDAEALVRDAVRANVRASVNHLRHGSELLEQLIRNDGLLVVGAEYSLETGIVTFFEGVSDAG